MKRGNRDKSNEKWDYTTEYENKTKKVLLFLKKIPLLPFLFLLCPHNKHIRCCAGDNKDDNHTTNNSRERSRIVLT